MATGAFLTYRPMMWRTRRGLRPRRVVRRRRWFVRVWFGLVWFRILWIRMFWHV